MRGLLERAADTLTKAGARIDREARPAVDFREAVDLYVALLMPIMSLELPDAVARQMAQAGEQVPADAPGLLAASARANAARHRDWLRTHERRERIRARWAEFFRDSRRAAVPGDAHARLRAGPERVQHAPHPRERRGPLVHGEHRSGPRLVTMALLPSTVIPVGRTAGGLPVGVQIVGPYLEDRTTLAFARAAERELGGFAPPPGLAVSFHEIGVARVVDETPDARSFELAIPPELAERFRYRAGQYLTFEVPLGGERIVRCYSLASSPELGEPHKVTVKRVPEGRGSGWFHEHVKAGTRLRVMPPLGRFVLHDSPLPLLLFAGGSGITPVIGLIKSALATTTRRIRLLYANRDARSVIFATELEALAKRHPERLECLHHLDDAAGFADAERVRRARAGFEDAEAYLCGPGPFMALVEETLHAAGVPVGAHPDRALRAARAPRSGCGCCAGARSGGGRGAERDRRPPRGQDASHPVPGRPDAPRRRAEGRAPAAVRVRGGLLRLVRGEAPAGQRRARSQRRVHGAGARGRLDPHLPRPARPRPDCEISWDYVSGGG